MKPEEDGRKFPWRTALEVTVTSVFWGLWFYLVMPLVSALLWLAGIQVFVEQMIARGGYETLLDELSAYSGVVLLMLVAITLWIAWNKRHYGSHNTRTHALAAVTLMEEGAVAGVEPARLGELQEFRRLVVRFDDNDELVVEQVGSKAN